MEKERRVKALSIVALLIAIAGLTIAFAAMSRLLTINGTASVGKFDVHFATNNAFEGQGQIYDFTGTDGVTDATIASGEDGTAEIVDGVTVNNLKAQFDRTGDDSKATFKLYIVKDSNRTAYVNSITYGSDCNQTNSIQCSLKDLNGDAISTSTSIAAHGNMFVFLEVVAPDSTGSNTTNNDYDMQVQVIFSQDQVSQQSSGDDPVIVDDDSYTYYNISFKDLTNVDWTSLDLGMERRKHYYLFLVDNQDQISYFKFTKDEESPVLYVFRYIANTESEEEYNYESTKNGWKYYRPDENDYVDIIPSQLPSLNGYRILSASEMNEMSGEDAPDLMTEDMKLLLLNITPAS